MLNNNRKYREKFKNIFNSEYKFKNVFLYVVTFGVIGAAFIVASSAAPTQGLKAAANPKQALGVSGTTAASFANWLDRPNGQNDIIYGLQLGHFSPDTFNKQLANIYAGNQTREATIVYDISPVPGENLPFLPNRSMDVNLCGKEGIDYTTISQKYNGQNLAKGLLGNAKSDKNNNSLKDNVENLYRSYKGCYDNTYEEFAKILVANNMDGYWPNSGRPKLILRFAHEYNGDFYEWSAVNQTDSNKQLALNYAEGKTAEQLFTETFKRAHTIITNKIKQQSNNRTTKLYFDLNMTSAGADVDGLLERTYPGDQYVDVIGVDFYDRKYSLNCAPVKQSEKSAPNCRSDAEKTQGWSTLRRQLDFFTNFAQQKGKLIGISEWGASSAITKTNGVSYWRDGNDNSDHIQKVYEWLTEVTTQKKILSYIIYFDRNPSNASKELSSDFNIEGVKGLHRLSPGNTNSYQVPSNDPNAVCALEWDYYPLDSNNNPITTQPKVTHYSAFPEAAKKFLQLFSGSVNGGQSTNSRCPQGGGGGGGPTTPVNTSPVVVLSSNYSTSINTPVSISSIVTDDGLPANPGRVTYNWSKVSGTGTVTFDTPNSNNVNATFSAIGSYIIKLTANDGALSTEKQTTITVVQAPQTLSQFTFIDTTVTSNGTKNESVSFTGPADWNTPSNFADGQFYAKVDITDIPESSDANLGLQLCLFRNGLVEQTCSGIVPFEGNDSVYALLGTPSSATWFKKGGSWDFSKPIESVKLYFKDLDTGKNLLTTNCATTCSTEEVVANNMPISIDLQVVAVSKNSNIVALEGWGGINCPIEFGCNQSIDTTKPTVRIKNPNNSLATKDVTLTVEASDDSGIGKVEYRFANNNSLIGDTSTFPYSLNLGVNGNSGYKNGNYSIIAIAYDTNGNTASSNNTVIKVRNPDINRDGRVEIGDLTSVISSWNQSTTQPANIAYDLDDDGVIGIGDLTILISKWNQGN